MSLLRWMGVSQQTSAQSRGNSQMHSADKSLETAGISPADAKRFGFENVCILLVLVVNLQHTLKAAFGNPVRLWSVWDLLCRSLKANSTRSQLQRLPLNGRMLFLIYFTSINRSVRFRRADLLYFAARQMFADD
jgi:hypothetical protein